MSPIEQTDPTALLTAENVAELLGVAVAQVYAESRGGRIPVRLGRPRRYRREVIEGWSRAIDSPSGIRRRCV